MITIDTILIPLKGNGTVASFFVYHLRIMYATAINEATMTSPVLMLLTIILYLQITLLDVFID